MKNVVGRKMFYSISPNSRIWRLRGCRIKMCNKETLLSRLVTWAHYVSVYLKNCANPSKGFIFSITKQKLCVPLKTVIQKIRVLVGIVKHFVWTLLGKSKCFNSDRPLKIRDVIINDPHSLRNFWPLGIVQITCMFVSVYTWKDE